jgi:hypothetical protein
VSSCEFTQKLVHCFTALHQAQQIGSKTVCQQAQLSCQTLSWDMQHLF